MAGFFTVGCIILAIVFSLQRQQSQSVKTISQATFIQTNYASKEALDTLHSLNNQTLGNQAQPTVVMVYRKGCPYCANARKIIYQNLANRSKNQDPVNFLQVDESSSLGKQFVTLTKSEHVPITITFKQLGATQKISYTIGDNEKALQKALKILR